MCKYFELKKLSIIFNTVSIIIIENSSCKKCLNFESVI